MKKQVVVIHGGETFDSYKKYLSFLKNFKIDFDKIRRPKIDWKTTLQKKLGINFDVVLPTMPNKLNTKYTEWKIWFEKFIPHLNPKVILIGHSLGGIFLVKYLSENKFPKKILAALLVAAPYNDKIKSGLADFILPKNLTKLEKQVGRIFLYHSKDDPVVPFTNLLKYREKIKGAVERVFPNRKHFNQTNFPELIKNIRGLKL